MTGKLDFILSFVGIIEGSWASESSNLVYLSSKTKDVIGVQFSYLSELILISYFFFCVLFHIVDEFSGVRNLTYH